jgi:peptidoglycan/LPS O-acetylase OafA/YrhL
MWPQYDGTHSAQAYRADIDGLRAVAVLAVVLYHAFPALVPGGFIGVDVFFVISGFLITGIIHKNLKNDRFSFADFWARRIRRIFPSLLTVIVAVFVAGWFYLLPNEFDSLKSHIMWGLGFAANFKLNSEVGYFDVAAELKPLLHLWSLAIEEQFYFIWPGLLWFCYRNKWNLFTVTLVLALLSFSWRRLTPHSESEAFYLPFTRFWEFQIGGLIAVCAEDYSALCKRYARWVEEKIRPILLREGDAGDGSKLISSAVGIAGGALIAYACLKFDRGTPFPSRYTLVPVLGAALVVMAGRGAWFNRKVLSLRPMVFIGLISFPLYLWHWPMITYGRIVLEQPSQKAIAIIVAASLALSAFTYYYVERVLRFDYGRLKWRAPVLLATLCAFIFFVKYAAVEANSSKLKTGIDKIDTAIKSHPLFPTKAMTQKKHPNGYLYYELKTNVPRYTLFIGDSHMFHYAARIEKIALENPNQTRSSLWLAEGGCFLG